MPCSVIQIYLSDTWSSWHRYIFWGMIQCLSLFKSECREASSWPGIESVVGKKIVKDDNVISIPRIWQIMLEKFFTDK